MTSALVGIRRDPRAMLWLAVAMAVALRIAAAALLPDQSAQLGDALTYRALGRHLWETHSLGNPYFMPLYPALVGVLGPGWLQFLVDIAFSAALVWLVYELTVAMFEDTAAALLAALCTAIYPQFIFFSVVGLTESMFIMLIVGAFLSWYRGYFILAAVLSVLSILTRPAVDLLAPLLVIYFAAVVHRQPIREWLRQIVVYGVIYCALMAPWWFHNYQAYGRFVRLNLAAGEQFYGGNNPMNTSGGGVAGADFSRSLYAAIENPVERDRVAWNAAADFVKQDPIGFVERAFVKFGRFWRFWPYAPGYSNWAIAVLYVVSYGPIFLLTLVYLALWGIRDFFRIAPVLAFAGYLTLVNVVFVASIRYRLPLEPFMIVFATIAIMRLLRRSPSGLAFLARIGMGR